jgi:hypothetical protein
MNGGFYKIELEENAIPFNKGSSRTVPEPCMEKLKTELELQLGLGLIEQVPASEKSEWLHPIVVAPKKDGSIRLCVDLRMLNKFVKRQENPQRSPWEVVRTIPTGCKHFATFDAFKGYHQVDPESRKLTTFHTPFGRYRYVRLAMGLSSAGDVFTMRYGDAVDYTIEGRRCTKDTLIHGHTSEELARKTKDFVSACAEAGITLNNKKFPTTNRRLFSEVTSSVRLVTLSILLSRQHYQNFQYQNRRPTSDLSAASRTRCATFQMTFPRHWHRSNTY